MRLYPLTRESRELRREKGRDCRRWPRSFAAENVRLGLGNTQAAVQEILGGGGFTRYREGLYWQPMRPVP